MLPVITLLCKSALSECSHDLPQQRLTSRRTRINKISNRLQGSSNIHPSQVPSASIQSALTLTGCLKRPCNHP